MESRPNIYWSIISFVCVFSISISAANAGSLKEMLTGFIEAEFAGGLNRISLSSGKENQILGREYRVTSFDLSPMGDDRVLALGQKGNEPSRLNLYLSGGAFKTIMAKDFVAFPSYSPDGSKIAYLFGDTSQLTKKANIDWYLYIIDSKGTNNKRVTNLVLESFRPSWLADGKRLAVTTKDFKVSIVDIETGEEKKIIDFGVAPVISHSGDKIAYLSNDIDEATKGKLIYQQNISKKEELEIQNEKGKRLKERFEIYKLISKHFICIYDITSDKSEKISGLALIDGTPVWSPDDNYLAYTDDGLVGLEIYVLDIKKREKEKLDGKHGRVMVWRNKSS